MKLPGKALWRKALAVLPVLAVLTSGPSLALLRCRMDGALRVTCCCPEEGQVGVPAQTGAALSAPPCCERVVSDQLMTPMAGGRVGEATLEVAVPVTLPPRWVTLEPEGRLASPSLPRQRLPRR